MRFVVHIGPQKTGTTTLQDTLYAMRDHLAADGILYMTDLPDFRIANARRSVLGEALQQAALPDIAGAFTRARNQGYHTAIISSELLAHLRADQLRPLRAAIGGAPAVVVAYCRRWSARLPSLWAQRQKGRAGPPFPDWCLGAMVHAQTTEFVNEAVMWRKWADLFGPDSLRIVSHDVLMHAKADIVDDFLASFVGWRGQIAPELRAERLNTRWSPLMTEVARALAEMARLRGEQFLLSRRGELLSARRGEGMDAFRTMLAPAAATWRINDETPILAACAAQMAAFSGAVVPRAGDCRLMIPGVAVHRYYLAGWTMLPGAMALLEDLYAQLEPVKLAA
jgi:hypothetical protein